MAETPKYSVYDRLDFTLIARGEVFPLRGMPLSMRRDPEALTVNQCPPPVAGKRYLLEEVSRPALGPRQAYGNPSYGTPDFDEGTISVTYPVVSIGVSSAKDILHEEADAKVEALIQEGFSYEIPGSGNSYTYKIDDRTQIHMQAIQTDLNNGGSGPVVGVWPDVNDVDRTFTDEQWEAFARAARTYKEAILRNLRLLHRDIDAAANQGAINQIDIEDGTGRNNPTAGVNASGWPTNGS